MKPSKKTHVKLDKIIKIRISEIEHVALKESADTAGFTLSFLLRQAGQKVTITSSTDRMMVRELRKIGGLLKKVHIDSGGAYSEKTATAIEAIARFVDGLSGLLNDH